MKYLLYKNHLTYLNEIKYDASIRMKLNMTLAYERIPHILHKVKDIVIWHTYTWFKEINVLIFKVIKSYFIKNNNTDVNDIKKTRYAIFYFQTDVSF